MIKKLLTAFAVILLVYLIFFKSIYNGIEPIRINIKPGMSVFAIHKKLSQTKQVENSWVFYRLSQLLQLDDELQAGVYLLSPKITAWQLLWKLKHGSTIKYKITLVEGWGFLQIKSAIDTAPHLQHLIKNTSSLALAKKLGCNKNSMEGYLYPDTYYYDDNTTDLDIYNQAYAKMLYILNKQWQNKQSNLYYKTPYQALIVASLIERESKYIPEQAKIAAVILNRLQKHMRLQIDAAVFYGLNKVSGVLSKKDLQYKTPYNLYKIYGLPPTPIAMPAEPAIYAALHPANTQALFYVLENNGQHVFSHTYKDHLTAIKRIKKSK